MLKIIFIEFNLDGYRKFIAPMNLGPSGEAGGEKMDPLFRSQGDKIILIEQGGPRPDKTHVAAQNTQELRKFIKAGFAEKPADGGEETGRIA